jgi:hypothetical protein
MSIKLIKLYVLLGLKRLLTGPEPSMPAELEDGYEVRAWDDPLDLSLDNLEVRRILWALHPSVYKPQAQLGAAALVIPSRTTKILAWLIEQGLAREERSPYQKHDDAYPTYVKTA